MKFLVLVLLFAVTVGAQTANVIELTPADQARAQKAWDALQKAQAEWDSERKQLEERYVLVKRDDPDAGSASTTINVAPGAYTATYGCGIVIGQSVECPKESIEEIERRKKEQELWDDAHWRYYRKGFENGFEFDGTFRFIVPKPAPPPANYYPFTVRPAGFVAD